MSSALRPVLLLTVVVGLFFAVAILGRTTFGGQSDSTGVEIKAGSSATLADRYHQRKRTQQFFDRTKKSSSKSRPSSGLLTPRKRRHRAEATVADDRFLAGRYHQRERTSQFFKRAVG